MVLSRPDLMGTLMLRKLLKLIFGGADEWTDWRPTRRERSADWAIHATMHVRGTRYRSANARNFVRHAKSRIKAGDIVEVHVEREPENPVDKNALRVMGRVGSTWLHIGYLPAESAAAIALGFPADMPLRASLSRVSERRGRFAIFVDVLRPAKRSEWWKSRAPDASARL